MKGGKSFMGGISAGTTKYHRKICTSSGMLRNSSTQALPRRTSQGLSGSVRITPTTEPTTSATTRAVSDTATVQPQAENNQLR
jgi:hypothetical protein